MLRVVEGGAGVAAGTELVLKTVVTLGRAEECDLVFAEQDVSRAHARLEITPEGVALTDLGSSYGTWIAKSKIERTVILKPGERFRLGGRVLIECVAPEVPAALPAPPPHAHVEERDVTQFVFTPKDAQPPAAPSPVKGRAPVTAPPPSGVAAPGPPAAAARAAEAPAPIGDADFSSTVVIPMAARPPAGPGRLEEAGTVVDVSAHRPFLLDDPSTVWRVESKAA